MKQFLTTIFIVVLTTKIDSISSDFRPPAVPLIVFSPHVSGESYYFDKKHVVYDLSF